MGNALQKLSRSIRKRIAPAKGLAAARERMPDLTEADLAIMHDAEPYTMVSAERMMAVIDAVRYVEQNSIDGAIVECGVWKGGSTIAAIRALQESGGGNRDFYLYDTFEGMSVPTEHDKDLNGSDAILKFERFKHAEQTADWCRCSLDDVRSSVLATGYEESRITFVKGLVEDTIPGTIPDQIAVLRLDTDFYESTKHELEHLFPRLQRGGILLIDDYGHWQGARKAVDEYMSDNKISMFLSRSDYTGRAGVKL